MLEKYSRNQQYMYIRKKKAARQKRKQIAPEINGLPEEYIGEEGDQPDRDAPSYAEHAFTFTSFEKVRFHCSCHELRAVAFRPRKRRQHLVGVLG